MAHTSRPSPRAWRSALSSTGFEVTDGAYSGGGLDWLTPFTLFTGFGLVVAYALLGCTWLIMKTEGALQDRMHDLARPVTLAVLAVIGIVSLWTPLAHPAVAARWFTLPNLFFFAPVPILVLLVYMGNPAHAPAGQPCAPFLLTLVLLFLGYSGLGISLWPNIIPPSISIWDAAAPPQSMGFTLVGRTVHHPVHPRLHRLDLLRLPRQGESGRGISLMESQPRSASRKWLSRVGWLILIWVTSIAALGTVALVLRAIMSVTGMTV